ncbi:VIT1/CCC1 transporter family protein [Leucobacter tenebrionis]|uniref:VIT1/CCC1 transporter family protein n=1 Tax=Leucobacter tenebrionis TaxID=2873270 RepID=UPI002102DD2E|nr:VIT family protein [Leucobacter tenebrionis]
MSEILPSTSPTSTHEGEPHGQGMGQRLNWLRAGVLGANDGIVSTAGVVIGVAGATPNNLVAIATAGIAALVAGAFSMAGGEYVSVSTQRDTERAMIAKEERELAEMPEEELEELAGFYRERGLSEHLAKQVAVELTAKDALAAHAEVELGIDPNEYTSPWAAAVSSFVSFTVGALIPLVMILLPFGEHRVWIAAAAVVIGLFLTGWISAALGGAPRGRAILRNVVMGSATMVATYVIGMIFGVAVS